MPKTAKIILTSVGSSGTPFDLYSDQDNYQSPFETGVSPASLLAGYTTNLVPDDATIIRLKKEGCEPYLDIKLPCFSCDNCVNPFDALIDAVIDAYNTPGNTSSYEDLFDIILDRGIVSNESGVLCCPDCFRYVFASVETWLKYAEAVGLTQSPAP